MRATNKVQQHIKSKSSKHGPYPLNQFRSKPRDADWIKVASIALRFFDLTPLGFKPFLPRPNEGIVFFNTSDP